jgi:hypothetical protein
MTEAYGHEQTSTSLLPTCGADNVPRSTRGTRFLAAWRLAAVTTTLAGVALVVLTPLGCTEGTSTSSTSTTAMVCSGPLTAASGPPTWEAALAQLCSTAYWLGPCGNYLVILACPPGAEILPCKLYFYGSDSHQLFAVVDREDAAPDSCIAGPPTLYEPEGAGNGSCLAVDYSSQCPAAGRDQ